MELKETHVITNGPSRLEYVTYSMTDNLPDDFNFMVTDCLEMLKLTDPDIDGIVYITDIFTEPTERGKGNASKLLKSFTDENRFIVVRCGLLMKYYPERPTVEEFKEELVRQSMFFEKNGFRSMNVISEFEHSVPYVYINKESKNFIRNILEKEIQIDDNY